ncbi:MAG: hypothetical protein QOF01_2663, partial [Thermomicrobiales bacterium]|nr:hypothetical protein [Thermomicrobiales bacterium]
RRGKLLTLQAYRESGGVAGAIAKRADTVFESLPEDQRPLVRRVMLRLTEPGEGTEDTRRRATLDELVTDPTRREAVEAAVAALTDARLLTVGSTADESAPVVDVAHEALIRGWPRLRTWLDEDRAGLRLHRRLSEAAQEWQRLGEDEGALYRGSRLTEALEFRDRHPDTINDLERRFLAAGAALRDAEVLQRERARRARERLQRRIGAALAVGLLVAATLAILAWTQRGEAQAGRRGAVQAQQTADARRVESDDAKATAEVRRLEAEQAQQTAESRRHEAETARSDADVQKAAAVAAQATADVRRIEAENAEATAEARRQDAAAAQQTAEASGKEAKDQAATAEANRAEANRQATVATEQKAETERQAAQVKQARLRQLAAQAVNEPAGDLALLLGAEAYRLSPDTVESRSGLLTTLSRTPQLSAFLQGHNGETSAVAVSPDGSIIAGGDGSIIMLWDAATYERLATLDDGRPGLVRSLAISPNGRMLAVGRGSGTISLWDLPTRQLLVPVVDERGDSVRSVSFNASGEQLAAASHDGTVLIWDVARQSVVDVLHGSPEGVSSVAYSPDDRFIVAGLEDGHVAVWDATERRLLRYLPVSNWVADVSVAFDPEGVLFAAGAFPGVVTLWSVSDDANTWEQISRPVSTPFEYVQDIDFGPNGKWLAASSLDGRIIAWDASTFVVTGTDSELGALAVATTELYAGYATVVFGIAFAGGDRLVSTLSITTLPGAESESGAVVVWDLAADSRLATRVAGLQAAGDLAFIAGSQLLVPGPEGLSAWDPATRAVVPERVIRGGEQIVAAVTTDGRTIAVAREDGGIDLWNAASWTQIGPSLPSQGEAVVALAFSRDGTLLAGLSEHSVLLWDLRTRTSLDPLTTTSATLTSLAFGKDGLLAIGSDKRVGLWDTTNRVRINSFEEEANRLAFNPDGTLLAVATYIEIVLWDVQASRVVDRLVNPLSLSIGVVAFDPSGGLLAGGGANGVLILWDISSRRLLGVLSGSSSVRPLISSIAFSPDGNTVAASDRDGAISVYPVRPSDWVARACAIAGRNLTLAEWSVYLSDTPYEFVCPPVPEGPMGTPVARRRKDSPSTIGRH